MITIDRTFVQSRMVRRKNDAHKGDFGKILVYAGSPGMTGAAILCGKAALRSGAGLVRYLLPSFDSPLLNILQCSVPEATCIAYKEGMDFSEYSAIACGPGLGMAGGSTLPEELSSYDILKDILLRYKKGSLVLDADALNMAAAFPELGALIRKSDTNIVMTPHVGEAKRLLKAGFPEKSEKYCAKADEMPDIDWKNDAGRKCAAEMLAEKYSCTVVLKGAGTLVVSGKKCCINTTGNPGMATGGSGDVLTGVIASLCAQNYPAEDAAAMGVWIHGMAGDIAAEDLGEMGMISSDLPNYVPEVLKSVYPPADCHKL